ncbi:MAG: hypothetical protein D6679_02065 [Candidatus Hydrogenedentota bacterium]|nr:MAG: hypothetical protein D6679_02065 [Candidatus Hydrogenedentota bacterium]
MECDASTKEEPVPKEKPFLLRGQVIDGTGRKAFPGEVWVEEGRIVRVRSGFSRSAPRRYSRIGTDCAFIAPGFIDTHGHSDHFLLIDPRAESKVLQGVTTEVIGNCGSSAAPLPPRLHKFWMRNLVRFGLAPEWESLSEYIELLARAHPAVNVVTLVGHATLAAGLGKQENVSGRGGEAKRVRCLMERFRKCLDEGAAGISFGLAYPEGLTAGWDEVLALARTAAEADRIAAFHVRDEGAGIVAAVNEMLEIGARSGVRIQYSHIKTLGKRAERQGARIERMLSRAREEGVRLSADLYPYTFAAMTFPEGLSQASGIPPAQLRVPTTRTRDALRRYLFEEGGLRIRIFDAPRKEWCGQRLCDFRDPIEKLWGLIRMGRAVTAAFPGISRANLDRFLRLDCVAIGTDAANRSREGALHYGAVHPRAFGTFPRFLNRWVRRKKALTWENAIHRITSRPAEWFGLRDRGLLKEGYFADIVLFRPDKIEDRATFSDPFRAPVGIEGVWVNGVRVVERGGRLTGRRPGVVIRF